MVEHPKKPILFDSHIEKKKHETESRLYVVIRSDKVISGYEGFFIRSFFFSSFFGDCNAQYYIGKPLRFLYPKQKLYHTFRFFQLY